MLLYLLVTLFVTWLYSCLHSKLSSSLIVLLPPMSDIMIKVTKKDPRIMEHMRHTTRLCHLGCFLGMVLCRVDE